MSGGTRVIRGGTVINATGAIAADVVIEGERIAALLAPGSDLLDSAAGGDTQIVDATGRHVIPGGVDVHVHLQLPMTRGATSSDTFESGTRAAAFGGTTTVIDFAGQLHGTSVMDAFEDRLAEAEGQCAIDYGLHLSAGDVHEQSLKDMRTLIDEGVSSFKLFMAYPGAWYSDDGKILQAMQMATETGAMIMMHAENGIAIDVLREQAGARGQTDSVWHGKTRPAELEGEAAHRAIQLAAVAGAPLYIVHVSAAQAVEQVVRARDQGRNVFAETCPQYLYLSLEEHLDQPGIDGIRHICSPPLRPRSDEHQDRLWTRLRTDDLSVVSTDHCPFCDADVVIYDPAASHTLGVDSHHMNIDNSVWEGMHVTGGAETVLSRGEVVVDKGVFTGSAGHGRYLRRGLPEPLR